MQTIRLFAFLLALVWTTQASAQTPPTPPASPPQTSTPYTPDQLQQAIEKARNEKIQEAQRKDKPLQRIRKAEVALQTKQAAGTCKTIKLPFVAPLELCIKPHKGNSTLFVNGQPKEVPAALHGAANSLKKAYRIAKAKADKLAQKLSTQGKKRAEQVANRSSQMFDKALEKYRKKVAALAQKLANSPEWKQRLAAQIAIVALSKADEASQMAREKMKAKLQHTLDTYTNPQKLRDLANNKPAHKKGEAFDNKSLLLAVGLLMAHQAARIAFACWQQSGPQKRTCLNQQIATGMRDGLFDVLALLVRTVLDTHVIAPLSHSLATALTAHRLLSTASIGSAAYPTAYAASSIAFHGMLSTLYEVLLRPEYNKIFETRLRAHVETFNDKLIRKLPETALRCWGSCTQPTPNR